MASKLQPALLAGLTLGILSGLPFVNMANACCCLWVVAGGVLATYLLQQNQPAPVSYGDGALVGLFAGIVGFFVSAALGALVSLLPPPIGGTFQEQFAEMIREAPPEMRDVVDQVGLGLLLLFTAFFGFVVTVVMATVGGLLGTALFQKKTPPPAAWAPPSPAPPPALG